MSAITDTVVPPRHLAHFVLKTARFREMIDWYKTVLGAQATFENEMLAFLTYDDEHHRVAIANIPNLQDQQEQSCGVHHCAFSYGDLGTLFGQYARLKQRGITPSLAINHGPTTSLYYRDPDGNRIELQVDNFDTVEEATRFFYTDAFAKNPIGVDFDPDEMLARLRAGEDEHELKKRPESGARDLSGVRM
jgi:catechol-2,3-dioxygenase